jgi:hypothetical protein
MAAVVAWMPGSQAAAQYPSYTPGSTYYFTQGMIEYHAGNLPLVLSVPHGGFLAPASMPDRSGAVVLLDDPWSREAALALADALHARTGRYPHMVVNNLARAKLDANRGLSDGAGNDPAAVAAWQAYMGLLTEASASAIGQCGRGLLLDLHTNGRPGGGIEFGYNVSRRLLTLSEEQLDEGSAGERSSIRSLLNLTGQPLGQVVRGPASLGALMEAHGYRAEPSLFRPVPLDSQYFDGGYITANYGSAQGGGVDAIQIDTYFEFVRPQTRKIYAGVMAQAILDFMHSWYGMHWEAGQADQGCSSYADVLPGQPNQAAIEALFGLGVLDSCQPSPRRFCPDDLLSRAQAGAWAWRIWEMARGQPPLAAGLAVADLPDDDPITPVLLGAWSVGLLQGCRSDALALCPDQPLQRGAAAWLGLHLLKGAGYLPPPPVGRFSDVPAWSLQGWWIEAAVNQGLMTPCRPGSKEAFCPEMPLTRAQGAALLARISAELLPAGAPAH